MIHTEAGLRFLAADDMIVSWRRRHGRPFEPSTTEWMNGVLATRGGAFVDAGASTGWFAIAAADRGHEVLAFEPNRRVYRRLQENAVLNGVRLATFSCALSDRDGEAVFRHNRDVRLTSGGSLETPCCAPGRMAAETVRCCRLDSVIRPELPVGLIKIDVEGHEIPVLRGAAGTVRRWRPHLVLEANTPHHREALAAWLTEAGYRWQEADQRNLLCTPEDRP